MHLDAGAIQRNRFDLDPNDLVVLQLLKYPVQYASLGPSIHPYIDRVPITEARGQSAPLTALLRHVKYRVQNIEVGQTDIASLPGMQCSIFENCSAVISMPQLSQIFID